MDVNEKALKSRHNSMSDEAILKLYREYGDGLAFAFFMFAAIIAVVPVSNSFNY